MVKAHGEQEFFAEYHREKDRDHPGQAQTDNQGESVPKAAVIGYHRKSGKERYGEYRQNQGVAPFPKSSYRTEHCKKEVFTAGLAGYAYPGGSLPGPFDLQGLQMVMFQIMDLAPLIGDMFRLVQAAEFEGKNFQKINPPL